MKLQYSGILCTKQINLQCDASESRSTYAIIQDSQLIAFGAKACTPMVTNIDVLPFKNQALCEYCIHM